MDYEEAKAIPGRKPEHTEAQVYNGKLMKRIK